MKTPGNCIEIFQQARPSLSIRDYFDKHAILNTVKGKSLRVFRHMILLTSSGHYYMKGLGLEIYLSIKLFYLWQVASSY